MSFPAWDALDQHSSRGFTGWPAQIKRFWSPDDDVHGALKTVIASASQTLDVAMYGWDDSELDDLFRAAWESEKIAVRICLDKTQAAGVHEHELLAKWPTNQGNLPFVIGESRKHRISHLKLCVVDGLLTVQGSTNWSLQGEELQNNECTVIRDPAVAQDAVWKIALTYSEMLSQQATASPAPTSAASSS